MLEKECVRTILRIMLSTGIARFPVTLMPVHYYLACRIQFFTKMKAGSGQMMMPPNSAEYSMIAAVVLFHDQTCECIRLADIAQEVHLDC